jgi:hypothetical protein
MDMANETLALAVESDTSTDDDYQAFCDALAMSARGRAFLAEHARRARAADTGMLLTVIDRLETLALPQTDSPPADSRRDELRGLLDAIRGLQADIDTSGLAMQVAKLISLVDIVQQRIEAMLVPARHEAVADENGAPESGPIVAADEPAAESTAPETELAAPKDELFSDEAVVGEVVDEVQTNFAPTESDDEQADVPSSDEPAPEVMAPDVAPEVAQATQQDLAQATQEDLAQDSVQVPLDAPEEPAPPLSAVEALPPEQPDEIAAAAADEMVPPAQTEDIAPAPVEAMPTAEQVDELAPAPVDITPPTDEPPAARSSAMPEVSWDEPAAPAWVAGPVPTAQPVVPRSAAALAIAAVIEQAAASAAEANAAPGFSVIKAGTIPPPPPFEGEDFFDADAPPMKTIRTADALAPIMALSDDERTALFT